MNQNAALPGWIMVCWLWVMERREAEITGLLKTGNNYDS